MHSAVAVVTLADYTAGGMLMVLLNVSLSKVCSRELCALVMTLVLRMLWAVILAEAALCVLISGPSTPCVGAY